MDNGHFYYLADQYFKDFPDPMLMLNKESIDGRSHDRPCFYAFKDTSSNIYWMIPFSSQVNKYRQYYNNKIQRYGACDTITFGKVLGKEKAFLLQNMCPTTSKYIKNQYIDSRANIPVRVDAILEKNLITKAKRVLALHRKGIRLIFPDVLAIEAQLKSNPTPN